MTTTAEYDLIPIYGRGGVVAHAKVSPEDAESVRAIRWNLDRWGYVRSARRIGGRRGRRVYMHRLVLGLGHADPLMADHINHDILDNRRGNLRAVTNRENQFNRRGPIATTSTGYRGVCRGKNGRFRAYCGHRYLGNFESAEEAARVAEAARAERGAA